MDPSLAPPPRVIGKGTIDSIQSGLFYGYLGLIQGVTERVVAELGNERLPSDRPLWTIHLVDGSEGGSVIVSRLHHCIADGIALTSVLLALADLSPDSPWPKGDDPVTNEDDGLFSGAMGAQVPR